MNGLNKEIRRLRVPAEPLVNLRLTINGSGGRAGNHRRLNQDADTTIPSPSAASFTVQPQSCASSRV